MSTFNSEAKIPLPEFLKALTSNGVPALKAMGVAGKIYKIHNTRGQLAQLTDSKLKSTGIEDKDVRKLVLAAIKKAGYNKALPTHGAGTSSSSPSASSATSTSTSTGNTTYASTQPETITKGARKKRRRDDDLNEFLPDRPPDEGETFSSLDFHEILDETVLMSKFTVVNRAPIMTAWAFVVAERMGFQREEALSIATVYTEMNAISKGVSLGIYKEGKQEGREAKKDGSQPYVDLMGRRQVIFSGPLPRPPRQTDASLTIGTHHCLLLGSYSYIKRSLQQTTPQIIGALRLLSQTYSPSEINTQGYSLYVDFRPEVGGWGKKGQVKCEKILSLRKQKHPESPQQDVRPQPTTTKEEAPQACGADEMIVPVKIERLDVDNDKIEDTASHGDEEPDRKKIKGMSWEEYEAALDADDTFALAVDALDSLP
ncbi:hypothetical protein NLI96_g2901 [Meripilus lineatus]|uniref:Uncharacterized protein n=1 Tax=Meripilus lineatus TaxID=2056292 RepID=A0AAD5V7V3_9APHY|nr:hypothetical protein NLI96_g2901 [Physisporinus lineatus]